MKLFYPSQGISWPIAVGNLGASLAAYEVDSGGGYRPASGGLTCSSSNPAVMTTFTSPLPECRGVGVVPGAAAMNVAYRGFTDSIDLAFTTVPRTFPYLTIAYGGGPPGRYPYLAPIRARVMNSDGSFRDVTSVAIWRSSDPSVATVENGQLIGTSVGNIEVTVSAEGLSGASRLSVPPQAY